MKRLKLVVVSDTHLPRFSKRLDAALRRVADERPDVILHCGDLTTILGTQAFETIAPVEAVAGNNDGAEIVERYGRRKIVEAGPVRIGMIHGDGTRGTTLGRARTAFENDRVDAIVFGHSHVPYLARHDRTWVVNPGSITDKRRQPHYSYAVLTIDDDVLDEPQLVYFDT